MLDFLKQYVFVASWISALAGITGLLLRKPRTAGGEIDWNRTILYILALVSFAAALTPQFDETAKTFARMIVSGLVGFLIVDRKPRT
jgi:predicted membrane channel-forming protein YqfA (hemolysin III family)